MRLIVLDAERRLGEMMAAQPKAKGGKPYQATGSQTDPVDRKATFTEAGIDKHKQTGFREPLTLSEAGIRLIPAFGRR